MKEEIACAYSRRRDPRRADVVEIVHLIHGRAACIPRPPLDECTWLRRLEFDALRQLRVLFAGNPAITALGCAINALLARSSEARRLQLEQLAAMLPLDVQGQIEMRVGTIHSYKNTPVIMRELRPEPRECVTFGEVCAVYRRI